MSGSLCGLSQVSSPLLGILCPSPDPIRVGLCLRVNLLPAHAGSSSGLGTPKGPRIAQQRGLLGEGMVRTSEASAPLHRPLSSWAHLGPAGPLRLGHVTHGTEGVGGDLRALNSEGTHFLPRPGCFHSALLSPGQWVWHSGKHVCGQ